MTREIFKDIEKYYTDKLLQYGITPKGVDWKDEETQKLRFSQLLKIVDNSEHFTINDLGCGYGKLFDYLLEKKYSLKRYFGYDLAEEMVKKAHSLYREYCQAKFFKIGDNENINEAEFTVASGIFNVKMHYTESEWLAYVLKTIESMNKFSTKGFAFNILTKYSDKEHMREDLYYADPCFFFDFMKRNYSRNVALLHDYDLYEFTLLVRKG